MTANSAPLPAALPGPLFPTQLAAAGSTLLAETGWCSLVRAGVAQPSHQLPGWYRMPAVCLGSAHPLN